MRAALVALLGLVGAQASIAQGPALVGRTRVGATRRPVAGVEIAIPALRVGARSDDDGRYRLAGLPAGRHWVVVRAIEYARIGDSVSVGESGETTRDFELTSTVLALDTVVSAARGADSTRYISPALRGFEERRNLGFGRFLDEA